MVGTCLPQDIFKRYLLSRIALRLLKIIGPRLVGQERTGNTQLLGYGSKHLGQNFFFYFIVLDRFFPEEPSLPRTGYFQTVATIQLVWCVPISTVFYYKRREKRLSNGPVYRAWRANNVSGSVDANSKTPDTSSAAYCMLCRAVTRAFLLENGALYGGLYGHIYYCKRLLGSTNLSKISSNSMNSGPFASTHTSKVAHSPCAPAPLSMVQ